jgi:hypothetical protein
VGGWVGTLGYTGVPCTVSPPLMPWLKGRTPNWLKPKPKPVGVTLWVAATWSEGGARSGLAERQIEFQPVERENEFSKTIFDLRR